LCFEGIPEGGTGGLARGNPFEEICDLMHEAVLIADLKAGYPPLVHVRLVAIRDVDGGLAMHAAFITMVEILEPVQVV